MKGPDFVRGSDDALIDDRQDSRLPRARRLLPRGPKKFVVEKAGLGVRVSIVDWAPQSAETVGSSAVSYLVYWAETVDTTTAAGISAGFARATLLAPPIPAPGKEDGEASAFYSDPEYLTGYFFCVGVDVNGLRSQATAPIQIGTGMGGTVPPDVEHFQASESGEQHNLTTISTVSYSFRIPANGGGIDRVQFYFKNYPNRNQTSEGQSVRVTSGAGGTQTGKIDLPVGRRTGTGTIGIIGTTVSGVGTSFLSQCASGDKIEVFGVRGTVAFVVSNTSMTLLTWTGPTVTAVATWQVIAEIIMYAVSLGIDGARRDDPENAPSVTIVLDGDLSTPNAPSLTATVMGNIIRIEITPPVGTDLARILLYRATGAGVTFSKTTCAVIHPFAIDTSNPTQTFLWDDAKFTTYEREQGQTFSYFATAVNVREQESSASTRVEAGGRLDTGHDGDPTIPSRDGFKNVLFDGFIGGDGVTIGGVNNVVDDSDTTQNVFNNIRANDGTDAFGTLQNAQTQAGLGGGTSRLRAWSRWKYEQVGGATVYPVHISGNEVKLPAPGAAKEVRISEWILAWNTGTQVNKKIKKGGYYSLQVMVWTDATVSGTFYIGIAQWAGAVATWALLRTRAADDTISESSASAFGVAGSSLGTISSSSPEKVYANFRLDPSIATDKISVTFIHANSTAGNIFIKEAALTEGIEIGPWTGDMGNVDVNYPTGTNSPGQDRDHDGHRTGHEV